MEGRGKMMRFNFCREIGLFALVLCLAASSEGMAQPVCGPLSLTQNFDPDTVTNTGIACALAGPNHENRYARSYDLSTCSAQGNDFQVNCVSFAVQENDTADYTVWINIYQDLDGGIPVADGVDLLLLGSASVVIPVVTAASPEIEKHFTVDFTALLDPIVLPADSVMVVELLLPDRRLPGGDEGFMKPGCNNTGESTVAGGPSVSYILAPDCIGTDYAAVDSAGFPDAMLIQVVTGELIESLPACPGDCAGADGNVNVTDLLALLGGWGQPAQACNIAGGDDVINVTDLLALLGGWGACPLRPELCVGDTNNSGTINVTDLLVLLGAWGIADCTTADFDFNGIINVTDLLILLGAWGACPP